MPTQSVELTWPSEAKITLKLHMADVCRLLRRATSSGTEFRWYHPYDLCLNFNSARFSTPTERSSVYPQIELHYYYSKAKGDTEQTTRTGDGSKEGAVSHQELDLTAAFENLSITPEANPESPSKSSGLAEPEHRSHHSGSVQQGDGGQNDEDDIGGIGGRVHKRERHAPRVIWSAAQEPQKKSSKRTRYPDLSVLTTILAEEEAEEGIDSIQSIWELKKPRCAVDDESSLDPDNAPQVQDILGAVYEDSDSLTQLLEQANAGLTGYPHQTNMHIFGVHGYWVGKWALKRSMFEKFADTDIRELTLGQMKRFFPKKNAFFPLLRHDKSDYSPQFMAAWEAASDDVRKAVDELKSTLQTQDTAEPTP